MAPESWLFAGESNLRASRVGRIRGKRNDSSTHRVTDTDSSTALSSFNPAHADVGVNHVFHNLRLVEKCFHRTNSDECSELVDFRNSPFDHFVIFHAEQNCVKTNLLVNCTITVDDSPTAKRLVVCGQKDEAVLLVETTLESGHGQSVNVIVEGSALTHVFSRNADSVFP